MGYLYVCIVAKFFFSIFRRPPNPITRFKPVCACVPEYGVPETLRIRKA